MPKLPATGRFQKLVDDISRFYTDAKYGARLIPELSKVLSRKFGPGFLPRTLQKTRHFYTRHSIPPTSAELGWTDYVELMPVLDNR